MFALSKFAIHSQRLDRPVGEIHWRFYDPDPEGSGLQVIVDVGWIKVVNGDKEIVSFWLRHPNRGEVKGVFGSSLLLSVLLPRSNSLFRLKFQFDSIPLGGGADAAAARADFVGHLGRLGMIAESNPPPGNREARPENPGSAVDVGAAPERNLPSQRPFAVDSSSSLATSSFNDSNKLYGHRIINHDAVGPTPSAQNHSMSHQEPVLQQSLPPAPQVLQAFQPPPIQQVFQAPSVRLPLQQSAFNFASTGQIPQFAQQQYLQQPPLQPFLFQSCQKGKKACASKKKAPPKTTKRSASFNAQSHCCSQSQFDGEEMFSQGFDETMHPSYQHSQDYRPHASCSNSFLPPRAPQRIVRQCCPSFAHDESEAARHAREIGENLRSLQEARDPRRIAEKLEVEREKRRVLLDELLSSQAAPEAAEEAPHHLQQAPRASEAMPWDSQRAATGSQSMQQNQTQLSINQFDNQKQQQPQNSAKSPSRQNALSQQSLLSALQPNEQQRLIPPASPNRARCETLNETDERVEDQRGDHLIDDQRIEEILTKRMSLKQKINEIKNVLSRESSFEEKDQRRQGLTALGESKLTAFNEAMAAVNEPEVDNELEARKEPEVAKPPEPRRMSNSFTDAQSTKTMSTLPSRQFEEESTKGFMIEKNKIHQENSIAALATNEQGSKTFDSVASRPDSDRPESPQNSESAPQLQRQQPSTSVTLIRRSSFPGCSPAIRRQVKRSLELVTSARPSQRSVSVDDSSRDLESLSNGFKFLSQKSGKSLFGNRVDIGGLDYDQPTYSTDAPSVAPVAPFLPAPPVPRFIPSIIKHPFRQIEKSPALPQASPARDFSPLLSETTENFRPGVRRSAAVTDLSVEYRQSERPSRKPNRKLSRTPSLDSAIGGFRRDPVRPPMKTRRLSFSVRGEKMNEASQDLFDDDDDDEIPNDVDIDRELSLKIDPKQKDIDKGKAVIYSPLLTEDSIRSLMEKPLLKDPQFYAKRGSSVEKKGASRLESLDDLWSDDGEEAMGDGEGDGIEKKKEGPESMDEDDEKLAKNVREIIDDCDKDSDADKLNEDKEKNYDVDDLSDVEILSDFQTKEKERRNRIEGANETIDETKGEEPTPRVADEPFDRAKAANVQVSPKPALLGIGERRFNEILCRAILSSGFRRSVEKVFSSEW